MDADEGDNASDDAIRFPGICFGMLTDWEVDGRWGSEGGCPSFVIFSICRVEDSVRC